MDFIPNQVMDSVFPSKTFHQIILMFMNTLNKVGGDACIKGSIRFAAKNVNKKMLQGFPLDSRLRGNDMITSL